MFTAYILADHGAEQVDIGFEETVETEAQARYVLTHLEADVLAAVESGCLDHGSFVSVIVDDESQAKVHKKSWGAYTGK